MSTTYNLSNRSGRSVLEFPVKVRGQYEVSCDYPQDTSGPQTVVAIGTGVGEKILKILLMSLVSMFGGMGSGALVIALISIMRKASKKKLAAYAAPSS